MEAKELMTSKKIVTIPSNLITKNVLVRFSIILQLELIVTHFKDECERGCPCVPNKPGDEVFPCQDVPTTPAPVTTTTAHETTTADWLVTTSWLNDTSTTPINDDIFDWRQIMGDKLGTLQILAITELVLAFIIYVSG